MSKPKIKYKFRPEHIQAMESVMNQYGDTVSAKPGKDGEIKIIRDRKELIKIEPEKDGSGS